MPEVSVERIEVDGRRVHSKTSCSKGLRRFFTGDDFQIRYSVDVSDVPSSILAIPVLSQICPIAWANGATVRTPVIDERFLQSLRQVRDALREMYPEFMEGGEIVADEVTDGQHIKGPETGMLFTGGVDSMATYFDLQENNPSLITMQGWVFKSTQSEQWSAVRDYVESFAAERNLECRFIESNLKGYLNGGMLDAHYRRYLTSPWYGGVGCGLGLLGLCAPLAAASGIGNLHIAATLYQGGSESKWGSHPSLDNKVAWSGTRCFHDGYELRRQDKVDRITSHLDEIHQEFVLQTCNHDVDNCSCCPKCLRTIVGLVVAGADPNRLGYSFDKTTLARVQEQFGRPEFQLEADLWGWQDIQRAIDLERTFPVHEDDINQFLRWLLELDLEQRIGEHKPPRSTRIKHAILRNSPYWVYSKLSSVSGSVSG